MPCLQRTYGGQTLKAKRELAKIHVIGLQERLDETLVWAAHALGWEARELSYSRKVTCHAHVLQHRLHTMLCVASCTTRMSLLFVCVYITWCGMVW